MKTVKKTLMSLALAFGLTQSVLASPFLFISLNPVPRSELERSAEKGCQKRGYRHADSTQFLQCGPFLCHQVLYTCR